MCKIAIIAKISEAIRKPIRCEFMARFSHADIPFVSNKSLSRRYPTVALSNRRPAPKSRRLDDYANHGQRHKENGRAGLRQDNGVTD